MGTYSGSSRPPALTASSGKMLLHFVTNGSVTKSGWSAKYTSSKAFCSGTTTLTSSTGTITDGSGSKYYDHNADCKWIIKPAGAGSVTLTFSSFSTESGVDLVRIYNGETTNAPLLSTYSGTGSIPAPVTASSGKMLVRFTSNATNKYAGFTANYTSSAKNFAGLLDENTEDDIVKIMPNPSNGKFSLVFPELSQASAFYITDVMGKLVYSSDIQPSGNVQKIDLSLNLANGMYYLTINTPEARISRIIVINREN